MVAISCECRPQFDLIVQIGELIRRILVHVGLHQHIQLLVVPVLILSDILIILGGFDIFDIRRGRSSINVLFNWRSGFMLL